MSPTLRAGFLAALLSFGFHGVIIGIAVLSSPARPVASSPKPAAQLDRPSAPGPFDGGLALYCGIGALAAGGVLVGGGMILASTRRTPVSEQKQSVASHPTHPAGNWHWRRLALAGAGILGVLSTFLPWISVPLLGSVTGLMGDGLITGPLFLPTILVAFLGRRDQAPSAGARLLGGLPAFASGILGAYKVLSINLMALGSAPDTPVVLFIQAGIGLYLLTAAGMAAAFLALIPWGPPSVTAEGGA